jgi:RsiW-degrading membrane proteinase PrsW (M82 family)
MRCRVCQSEVPDGVFCTVCGAEQQTVGGRGDHAKRPRRYAAHPDEHVAQPSVLTTLLPHLDHDRVHEFRWALIAGLGILLLLYLAGFIGAALLAAALLVPILYALYLYEVRTFRDAPIPVFGLTLGAGAVIGVVVSLVGNLIRSPLPTVDSGGFETVVNIPGLLLAGILIPVVQEVIKPLPAIALRRRPEFGETIDGLVFGVAAGLGFAGAQTIVQFSGVIARLGVRTDPAEWLFPLATFGVVLPILHGSSTGAITAAVWRFGRRRGGRLEVGGVIAAFASQIAVALGSPLLLAAGFGQAVILLWQALVVGGLLIYVRSVLHASLLDEARDFGLERRICPNCHNETTAGGFCPSCGMALTAVATARA